MPFFPVVWIILYIMTCLSMGLILRRKDDQKRLLRILFQLFLNFFWCYPFFVRQNPLNGLVCLVVLDWIAIWYAIKAWPVRKISSILFRPYLVWLRFATYLNLYLYN